MKKRCVTEVELKRYWVLMEVRHGSTSLKEASEVPVLSYRQREMGKEAPCRISHPFHS